ncbi:hypothetical protein MXB_1771 [Myxobolus squamalis]|nr:hypothetical protein MXB_1771 [Myxobolus squamalis]
MHQREIIEESAKCSNLLILIYLNWFMSFKISTRITPFYLKIFARELSLCQNTTIIMNQKFYLILKYQK